MPSTAILDLRFNPDTLDEAREAVHRVLTETRAFDGCLGVTVIEDKDDPAHLVAVEEWESLDKDAAYRAWRAGDGATGMADLAPHIAGPPSLIVGEPRSDL
jgi:heme oxygenase (mycobilin-producing)